MIITTELIKKIIYDYINKKDYVTYAQIERLFKENGYDYKGESTLANNDYPNIIFWCGWKEEAYLLLRELENEKLIYKHQSSFLCYLIDGKSLTFPIVKSIRQYKKEHWLPVCYRPVSVAKVQGDGNS